MSNDFGQDDALPPFARGPRSAPPRSDRSRNDKPRFANDRAPREGKPSDERPRRAYNEDRPRRSFDERGERPRRDFSDKPSRAYEEKRNGRDNPGEERPHRQQANGHYYNPRSQEIFCYGLKACEMAVKYRFDDLIKAYFTDTTAPHFASLMRDMAAAKKAYKIVGADDCERLSKTQHHEEVVMLFKRPSSLRIQDYLPSASASDCILALDGVANPHNLGAILRSAAHFGISAIMSRQVAGLQSGAALRVAEGGAEAVKLIESEYFIEDLDQLKRAGYQLATTSSHGGQSIYAKPLSKKTVIILGEESSGVSKAIEKMADRKIQIPGTQAVESLNVSVAAALMMGEWFRDWKAEA